jgi:carbon-monoxide dehydrogenase large subunit
MTDNPNIGASMRRKEDKDFLTGTAKYTDDLNFAGQAYAVFVRADIPHGRILSIDRDAVADAILVLTAADIADRITGPIPSFNDTAPFDIQGQDGKTAYDASQYPLARDRVRYLGEPVALVVADTLAKAQTAAEQVSIDYEQLAALTQYDQLLDAANESIWPDAGGNRSIDWRTGDQAAVDAAFEDAVTISRIDVVNNRIAPNFQEPRSTIADYDQAGDTLTLTTGNQGVHGLRDGLQLVLKLEDTTVRVVAPATGGGFGARNSLYPEYIVLSIAAMALGRPVKWTADRSESFLTDCQARDHMLHGEMAVDADGRFTGLRVHMNWRHGAYFTSRMVWVMLHYFLPMVAGAYRIPAIDVRVTGYFANTTPQSAFRGVGRMEANYLLESLIDKAAGDLDMDRISLRQLNFVTVADMPWASPTGAVYTSGDFQRVMDRALALAEWHSFPSRQQKSEARGLRRGIGFGMYVENDGSTPTEFAEVTAEVDGRVSLYVGTQDFGMGHQTIYSQILSDELGLPFDDIDVVFGDTAQVKRGAGTHGSRSARMGGTASLFGARQMVANGKEQAADMLEASVEDIEFADGHYTVAGTDRRIFLGDVAKAMQDAGEQLTGENVFTVDAEVHANGCQVSEVIVDPQTGQVTVINHVAVADVGTAINPMIVTGQLHGGAAQGISQALFEGVIYDPESGQTLTGSYMDYALPRASDVPYFETSLAPIAEQDNPLGVKGVGESSATGAPAAVMNAIRHAVGGHVDMPAKSEQVWRALQQTK